MHSHVHQAGAVKSLIRFVLLLSAGALALPAAADATVTAGFAGGTLTVSRNADDPITIACDTPGTNRVRVNDGAVAVPTNPLCSAVTSITVNGGPGGTQPISLAAVVPATFTGLPVATTAATVTGGAGDDSVVGSAFRDSINGGGGTNVMGAGEGDDSFTAANDGAINTFNGGSGTDTITFGNNSSNGSIIASPTGVTNLDGLQQIADIETATFNAPFQENTFDLTEATFASTVNGGGSNDTFFSSQFNDTFNGGGQGIADILSAKTDAANITVTNTSMSGPGIGTDMITGAERVQIFSVSARHLGGRRRQHVGRAAPSPAPSSFRAAPVTTR